MGVQVARLPVTSSDRDRAISPWLGVVLRAVVLGAVYAGIYKLIAVETSFGAAVGSTFWPASGVTVSVLVLRPRREWPLYLAAVWIADLTMDVAAAGFAAHA